MSMTGKGQGFGTLGAVLALGCGIALNDAGAVTVDLDWTTVVNNDDLVPTTDPKNFNSYNQPSINDAGVVVFRARSAGRARQGPATGIFTRDMATPGNPIVPVAMRGDVIPAPNTVTNPGPATFNEFPSFPRIDANSGTVAFRGQSTPSVVTTLPDGSETRSGTSGVYATPGAGTPVGGPLITGIRNTLPGGPAEFLVPNQAVPTKFDQFPGAPSPDGNIITFKGNWTDSNKRCPDRRLFPRHGRQRRNLAGGEDRRTRRCDPDERRTRWRFRRIRVDLAAQRGRRQDGVYRPRQ